MALRRFAQAVKRAQERAQALLDAFRAEEAKVSANEAYAYQTKQDLIAQARAAYQAGMDKLQEELREAAAADRAAIEEERQERVEAAGTEDRKLLGDAIFADLVRRRVEMLASDEIVAAIEAAPAGFERRLLQRYGALAIERRVRSKTPTAADRLAQEELAAAARAVTADLDEEAAALEEAERMIRALDQLGLSERRRVATVSMYGDF